MSSKIVFNHHSKNGSAVFMPNFEYDMRTTNHRTHHFVNKVTSFEEKTKDFSSTKS